ncbi:hypothetical protein H0A36_09105 [Endozoicomonas sp. SM1973]|uniref:Uncharacterized protein n=1 Tax=Spartinivicinus marinus TaxID=2994442 RepID=A0A853HWP8_9GAMM|nr:hypothetical protein [Spartinivicinus marinus]NYZ66170.1 hypothetical protein [Spartinivicinus marinus]
MYIHPDWFNETGITYINTDSSQILWNIAFQHFCQDLNLAVVFDQEVNADWQQLIILLLTHLDDCLEIAGIATVNDINAASYGVVKASYRRWASQLANALAINQRFAIPNELIKAKEKGAWLMYALLQSKHFESWQRLKLALEPSMVKNIEALHSVSDLSIKSQAVLLRFWRNITNRISINR